jgi:hypothetical protein
LIDEDETIRNLVCFFHATGSNNEDVLNIATLLAMPGSGKTRSIKEAAVKAGAIHKRVRIDASWSDHDYENDALQPNCPRTSDEGYHGRANGHSR